MNSYRKTKNAAKDIFVHGPKLETKVLQTMKYISDIVGSTLGPSGRAVLIERQEHGLPNMLTKDGVTVFRNLGFTDPTAQSIMEAARDASVRTASEAGDGTSTCAILSEAIVRYSSEFCKKNPKVSPQKIVRKLESLFRDVMEPEIKKLSMPATDEMLHSVAKLSANGDGALADVVIEAYDQVGDNGSISILELTGPSKYEVEVVDGYPLSVGDEECCSSLYPLFLNDKNNSRTFMEKPVFILYFGNITQTQTLMPIINKLVQAVFRPEEIGQTKSHTPNIVVMASGFSESVLGDLSVNFLRGDSINIFPVTLPKTPIQNSQMYLLHDLAAVTGATVFDPMSNPLDNATLGDLGYGIASFEVTRYRSTIFGHSDDSLILARSEEIKRTMESAESKFDLNQAAERLAALTGGVAKLKVYGSSSGELREKRDRAEDAVYAVRGAKKHGCLPGGCWTLNYLVNALANHLDSDGIVSDVLIPALNEPLIKLLNNCGLNDIEIQEVKAHYNADFKSDMQYRVFDAWNYKYVDATSAGILDSTPAVLEALRNSLSIASLLGTLGGTIVFQRDDFLERKEAELSQEYMDAAYGRG